MEELEGRDWLVLGFLLLFLHGISVNLAHVSGAPVGVFDQCVSPGDVLAVWVVMLLTDQKLLHCSLLQFVLECRWFVQSNEPHSLIVQTSSLSACLIDLLSIRNKHSSSRLPLIYRPGKLERAKQERKSVGEQAYTVPWR